MTWYYVDAGQQAGPVEDAQLAELVRSGRIQANTLVWNETMTAWIPYREVASLAPSPAGALPPIAFGGAPSAASSVGADQAVCAECGRLFNKQDMIAYGNAHVCAGCKPVFMQKLAEGARVNLGVLNYAGFWIRFGAKVIDGLILGVVFLPPLFYFMFKSAGTMRPGEFPDTFTLLQLLVQLGYFAANMAYTIFFLGKYGATPGKMACHLQVVTADGGKIGYGRATGRFFAEMLSGIVCYIGYIIAGFDSQKRALHDHICNTRVVLK